MGGEGGEGGAALEPSSLVLAVVGRQGLGAAGGEGGGGAGRVGGGRGQGSILQTGRGRIEEMTRHRGRTPSNPRRVRVAFLFLGYSISFS